MHVKLRNWFLCNLELSKYSLKTKLPHNAQSNEDNINIPPKTILLEKNQHISSSKLESSNLRLACWQPTKDLIIFNEMTRDILSCNETSKLLTNILSSIEYLPDSLLEPRIIDLPIAVEGTQDLAEASKMLTDFIDIRVKKSNTCLILLMGKTVFNVFFPSNLSYSDFLGKKIDINDKHKALILQSLQENLHSSIAKQGTWKAIKSLITK